MSDVDVRRTAWVHGRVQGVGFRWWTRSRALELGLTGYAANRPDGRVMVVAQGSRNGCYSCCRAEKHQATSTQLWSTGRRAAKPSAASPSGSLARRVPQESDAEGLQVLRLADDSAV